MSLTVWPDFGPCLRAPPIFLPSALQEIVSTYFGGPDRRPRTAHKPTHCKLTSGPVPSPLPAVSPRPQGLA